MAKSGLPLYITHSRLTHRCGCKHLLTHTFCSFFLTAVITHEFTKQFPFHVPCARAILELTLVCFQAARPDMKDTDKGRLDEKTRQGGMFSSRLN